MAHSAASIQEIPTMEGTLWFSTTADPEWNEGWFSIVESELRWARERDGHFTSVKLSMEAKVSACFHM
jgi:hypothetical protein